MVFSSPFFLFVFLPIVLILYYLVPLRFKNLVLCLSSLFFYFWGEQIYSILMLVSTVIDFTHGQIVAHFKEKGNDRLARLGVFSSVFFNLCLLFFFKYADFFVSILNATGLTNLEQPGIHLPIGISFYTFQTMSYTIDVYRGQAKVQKNILDFSTFVTLFPQLIAGPIVTYRQIEADLSPEARHGAAHADVLADSHAVGHGDSRTAGPADQRAGENLFAYGITRFVCGLFKKVCLANSIGLLWDTISGMETGSLTVLLAWMGVAAYTFQIYFDFSGYSDMAIGLGAMFGFHFPENFDHPYTAKSITEFWRRWHITLSSWFRDYVYIPLGGNRRGTAITIFNLFVTWALTGLWHGANANFVLWGLYYWLLLVLEKYVWGKLLKKLPSPVQHLYALSFIVLGWALFAVEDFGQLKNYLAAMFYAGSSGWTSSASWYYLRNYGILFLILIVGSTELPLKFFEKYTGNPKSIPQSACRLLILIGMMLLGITFTVAGTYNPFLYFRF